MLGGRSRYLDGWEPTSLDQSPRCGQWGNNMLFLTDDQRRIRAHVATYHGLRMLTRDWAMPRGVHEMYAAESDAHDADGNELLSAYVLRRPDGAWATLLVNKDSVRTYRVSLTGPGGAGAAWSNRATVTSFSSAQYGWRPDGANGRPLRSDPPSTYTLPAGESVVVPPYSLTVVKRSRSAEQPRKTQSTTAKP